MIDTRFNKPPKAIDRYLPLYFAEIGRFRNNSRSERFFRFLYQFLTAQAFPGALQAPPDCDAAPALLGIDNNYHYHYHYHYQL